MEEAEGKNLGLACCGRAESKEGSAHMEEHRGDENLTSYPADLYLIG
jgi:hypothetical protein